eukprot:6287756-Amphidinium_carterae.1
MQANALQDEIHELSKQESAQTAKVKELAQQVLPQSQSSGATTSVCHYPPLPVMHPDHIRTISDFFKSLSPFKVFRDKKCRVLRSSV